MGVRACWRPEAAREAQGFSELAADGRFFEILL